MQRQLRSSLLLMQHVQSHDFIFVIMIHFVCLRKIAGIRAPMLTHKSVCWGFGRFIHCKTGAQTIE